MTQFSVQNPGSVQPRPNVYTVLLMVACVALLVATIFAMASLSGDYGLGVGQLFDPPAIPH